MKFHFRYNGKSFGRTFNLRDYSGAEDLQKDYKVELTLIPIAADIAKIESIDLVPKQELIDQKGGQAMKSIQNNVSWLLSRYYCL